MKLGAASRLRVLQYDSASFYLGAEFMDQEFQRVCADMLSDETVEGFGTIVKQHLVPELDQLKKHLDLVARQSASRIRIWALQHLKEAQKLGRPTKIFEKLINEPEKAAQQLITRLLVSKK